jgi:hypothetical protein
MLWNGVFPAGSERQPWQELMENVRMEVFDNETQMLSVELAWNRFFFLGVEKRHQLFPGHDFGLQQGLSPV